MAELASGAVSALLGVIRNEQSLLSGVQGDVQFIKEEMESMNSFLLHLARTAPPGGEHNEQVRTWMGQVRQLAQDCNNCIDLYLYRGNPDIHLARSGLWRYLWLVPWFIQKMVAQHMAGIQLRKLKDRARDVGERRLRYGVEVPSKTAAGQSPASRARLTTAAATPLLPAQAVAPATDGGEDDEDDEDSDDQPVAIHNSGPREALFGLRSMEDYFNEKLADQIKEIVQPTNPRPTEGSTMPSIAIVAPDAEGARALATEALAAAKAHFQRSVLVDIPAVHYPDVLLEPEDILCYIWRDLEHITSKSQFLQEATTSQGQGKEQHIHWHGEGKWSIYCERRSAIREIRTTIREMKVQDKLKDIKSEIQKVKADKLQLDPEQLEKEVQDKISSEPLGVVLLLLLKSAAAAADEHDQAKKKDTLTLAAFYDDIIQQTAKKLEAHMEVEKKAGHIVLENAQDQYEHILREVFSKTRKSKPLQVQDQQDRSTTRNEARMTAGTSTLGEDHIKQMINKAKQEILHELQVEKYEKKHGAGKLGSHVQIHEGGTCQIETVQDQILKEEIKETIEKIEEIQWKIEKLMENKGIVDKIKNHLKDGERILVILKTDRNYVLGWEETRHALNLLNCVAGAVIVAVSEDNQGAKEYCNPRKDPMEYSLVGLYHDIVLELTSHQMIEDNYYICRLILDKCQSHEFCMKIFAHALYANPKRSNEELSKLSIILQVSPTSSGSIAKKMIKFSYNDLPKEYKSCLLYLGIFRQGVKIRRSTLIGRWVAEGLITTDDWRWSSSVRQAEHCFEELLNRWFIEPADTVVAGKVKSCKVSDPLVHEFITKIAKKQRILETRLSHHLAQHFSIFNSLHLRFFDTIHTFFQKIHETSQVSQLKVLDLEGCQCFHENKCYLKEICCKILLLKYLSLRGTDVTQLPSEINNLRELEVLDIRETKVPESATRNILLLKMKRLLAGHIDSIPSSTDTDKAVTAEGFPSSVQIPEKIEKMLDMEVLSNVKTKTSQDLKDIGTLWQLRKLGVVFENKDSHLNSLLEAIGNLHQNLQSLSITLVTTTGRKGTTCSGGWFLRNTSSRGLPAATNGPNLQCLSKALKTLSIRGATDEVQLLQKLLHNVDELTKVTLCSTFLNQADLDILAKLPKLLYFRLQNISCTEGNITVQDDGFPSLKYFIFEGSKMTGIHFQTGATPKLEEIALSFNIDGLPNLQEEHELNNNIATNTAAIAAEVDGQPKLEEHEVNKKNTTAATNIGDDGYPKQEKHELSTTATEADGLPKLEEDEVNNTKSTSCRNNNMFVSLFHSNAMEITKVTLCGTLLKESDIQNLAEKPNIRCLVLLEKSYVKSKLAFKKDEFLRLNSLVVYCSDVIEISFTSGSAPKLEKIAWSFNKDAVVTLSGIEELPKLKELKFNKDTLPNGIQEAMRKNRDRLVVEHIKPEENRE